MAIWNYRTKARLIQKLKVMPEGTMITCGDQAWVRSDSYWVMGAHQTWVDSDSELAERLIWLDEKLGLPYTLY